MDDAPERHDTQVGASPGRGHKRGRSWSRSASRSRSRSPCERDEDLRRAIRSRSRSRDRITRDVRDNGGNLRSPADPPYDHHPSIEPTGQGLGYKRSDDLALRDTFGGGHSGAREFSERNASNGFCAPRRDGNYNPLRRTEEVARRRNEGRRGWNTREVKPRGEGGDRTRRDAASFSQNDGQNLKINNHENTQRLAEKAERRAASSLGWRASSGPLPSKEQVIKGVSSQTLETLTKTLTSKKSELLEKKEIEKLEDSKNNVSGFEQLERRRVRRVGKSNKAGEDGVCGNSQEDMYANTSNKYLKSNPGVHDRARLDSKDAIDFSADGVRNALERKTRRYQESRDDCLLIRDTAVQGTAVEVEIESIGTAVESSASVAERKRQKLLAMKSRGSKRAQRAE